jgi:hypothetical protein
MGNFCSPVGDPALILAVPTERFRTELVFVTPDTYLQDYATVVAPSGATVLVDGRPLPAADFVPVGASGYSVSRISLPDGLHVVRADQPVSLVVHGYDDDVGYGYPAGLGL